MSSCRLLFVAAAGVLISALAVPNASASERGREPLAVPTSGFVSESAAAASGALVVTTSTVDRSGRRWGFSGANVNAFSIVAPPVGFNPLAATPAQLQSYGFPPKPTNLAGLASWTAAMRAFRDVPAPNLQFSVGTPIAEELQRKAQTPGADSSVNGVVRANWAGWAATATNNTWVTAESTFPATNVGPLCGPTSEMSTWTGLGGDRAPRLLQSGLVFNDHIPNQVSIWTPFWEDLNPAHPNPPHELVGVGDTAMAIAPEDQVFSSTSYNQASHQVQFYLGDESSGQSQDVIEPDRESYYSGTSADFVTEFTEGVEGAQFQSFATGMSAMSVTGQWYTLNHTSTDKFIDVNAFDQVKVTTSPLVPGGNEFSNAFARCE